MNHKHGLNLSESCNLACGSRLTYVPETYDELHKYSVTVDEFWKDLWDYAEIIYSKQPDKVRHIPLTPSKKTEIGHRARHTDRF